jgi:hypothetical protein
MTVKEFMETFIRVNAHKIVECGKSVLCVYFNSIRSDKYVYCEYDENYEIKVYENKFLLFSKSVSQDVKDLILNSEIKHIGNGDYSILEVVI